MDRILVIKLGALGDFILSYRAMTAIRAHHARARITLLTIASLKPLAEATGLFDDIWLDARPGIDQPGAWLALARRLNGGNFARVYDLQTSGRSGRYFRLLGFPFSMRRPQWSGIVRGCSHRHHAPDRTTKHSLERQADQLASAHLNAMNAMDATHPWELSFSYGRALQAPALKAWAGKDTAAGAAAYYHRAKCNGAARFGKYTDAMEAEAPTRGAAPSKSILGMA